MNYMASIALLQEDPITETAPVTAANSKKDTELSSAEMRAILLTFLNTISSLSTFLTEILEKRSENSEEITSDIAAMVKAVGIEIGKKIDAMNQSEASQNALNVVLSIIGWLVAGLTIIFSLGSGAVILATLTVVGLVLDKSGALSALSDALTKSMGPTAGLVVSIVLTLALSVGSGSVAGAFQLTFTKLGKVVADAVTDILQDAAAFGTKVASNISDYTKKFLGNMLQCVFKRPTSQGAAAAFQMFGSIAPQLMAKQIARVYVDVNDKDATEEKKKEDEQLTEMITSILFSLTALIGGISSMLKGSGVSLEGLPKMLGKALRSISQIALGTEILVSLAEGICSFTKGDISFDLADKQTDLAESQATQEFVQELGKVIAELPKHDQDVWKDLFNQTGQWLQKFLTENSDPDQAIARIISEYETNHMNHIKS